MSERSSNNLFRLLEVLAVRRGMVLGIVIVGTLLSVAMTLVLPQWYKAERSCFPKEQTIKAAGLAELAEVTSIAGGAKPAGFGDRFRFVCPHAQESRHLRSGN